MVLQLEEEAGNVVAWSEREEEQAVDEVRLNT